MTLIATWPFRVGNDLHHALIGDVAITNDAGVRIRAGRKLQRLRRGLAVGWCDQQVAARIAFRTLHERLPAAPSLDEVRTALGPLTPDDLDGSVEIIGLVHDSTYGLRPFKWTSASGEFDSSHDEYVAGSGTNDFKEIRQFAPAPWHPNMSAHQYRDYAVLNRVGELMHMEFTNQSPTFGEAYDILISAADGFDSVSPVVYGVMQANLDGNMRVVDMVPIAGGLRHWSKGEFTLLRRAFPGHLQGALVAPVYGTPHVEQRNTLERYTETNAYKKQILDGDYLMLFVHFSHSQPAVRIRDLKLVVPRGNPNWIGSNQTGITFATEPMKAQLEQYVAGEIRRANPQ